MSFPLVPGTHQRLPNCLVVTRTANDVNARIVGQRCPGRKQPNAVNPVRALRSGNGNHPLGLIDGTECGTPNSSIVEWRIQMIEPQNAHGRRIVGNDRQISVTGERLDGVAKHYFPTSQSRQSARLPWPTRGPRSATRCDQNARVSDQR